MLIALTLFSTAIATQNFPQTVDAQETQSAWTTLAPMNIPRGEFGLAAVGGRIYVIGGINGDNQLVSTVEEYNPNLNEWITKSAMPTARSDFAVAVYNDKIYVIGGKVGGIFLGNNEIYDPSTNSWSMGASMPTPRSDLSANVVNDAIYLVGGRKYASTDPFAVETGVNEAYYPQNDSWSTKTVAPTPAEDYASAVAGNKIYLIGGKKETTPQGMFTLLNTNQVYDPITNKWTSAASLPVVSSYGAATATSGIFAPQAVYFFGGFTGEAFSQIAEVYTPTNNSWNNIEAMPTARGYMGAVVLDDQIYVIGGFDGTNWLATNEMYKPSDYGTVPPKLQITSPENRTYRDVTLAYTTNKGAQWIGYSIDGGENITVTSSVHLLGLSQGGHRIVMYANDTAGNMGESNAVYFSVDSIAPQIVMFSPTNKSYDASDVQLSFYVDEGTSALEYSLDGQQNIPIIGNVTLVALSNGAHRITVFAADKIGNVQEVTVYFEVAPFPTLTVIAVVVIAIIVLALVYIVFKMRKPKNPKTENRRERKKGAEVPASPST